MAGVYILNFEVPENCDSCMFLGHTGCDTAVCKLSNTSFYIWDVGWGSLNNPEKPYIRHPSCPLVPVPDHGRLIDEDSISDKIYMLNEHYNYRLVFSASDIFDAPTIIPTDKGEP